jgi:HSP20 family protein
MLSLREAMNRLFDESFGWSPSDWAMRTESGLPIAVDMYEADDDKVVIKAALPGLKAEGVDISITGSTLTVKGELQAEEEGERGDVYFLERRYGKFQRSITLPGDIDPDAVDAEFEDGILTVTLPKTEEAKPKQIPVKAKS